MINPHGAKALDARIVTDDGHRQALLAEAETLPSLILNSAAAANAVMLGGGYFTPLKGFMNLDDAMSVATDMQTSDGLFWPVPVLNLTDNVDAIEGATRIALRDPNLDGNPVLAIMDVASIETVSDEQLDIMTQQVFGTLSTDHPGVAVLRGRRY